MSVAQPCKPKLSRVAHAPNTFAPQRGSVAAPAEMAALCALLLVSLGLCLWLVRKQIQRYTQAQFETEVTPGSMTSQRSTSLTHSSNRLLLIWLTGSP